MTIDSTSVPLSLSTQGEFLVMFRIADRMVTLARQDIGRVELIATLARYHVACPLRLRDILEADDEIFRYEVVGICKHLDRETGAVLEGFVSRYRQTEETGSR
jgi:hypothetical protein